MHPRRHHWPNGNTLREAVRLAHKAEKRKSNGGDGPPPSVFRGRRHKIQPGQLSFDNDDQAA